MHDFSLHTLDLVSIGGYLLIIIAIGFYVSRRIKDSTDYFLAGRLTMAAGVPFLQVC